LAESAPGEEPGGAPPPEAGEIETLPDHYLFEFETTGAITAGLALEQALKALDSHCVEFVAGLEAAA